MSRTSGTGGSGFVEKLIDRCCATPRAGLKLLRWRDATVLSIESVFSFGSVMARDISGADVEV